MRNLPSGAVQRLEVVRNLVDVLDGTVGTDDAVLHVVVPQAELGQIAKQVLVDDDEFAGKGAASVDVRGVGLEAFVVAEDLRGRCSRHGSQQQGVAHAVLFDFVLEHVPFPTVRWGDTPQVELQAAFRCRRTLEGLVSAFFFREVLGRRASCVVNRFENLTVQCAGFV